MILKVKLLSAVSEVQILVRTRTGYNKDTEDCRFEEFGEKRIRDPEKTGNKMCRSVLISALIELKPIVYFLFFVFGCG